MDKIRAFVSSVEKELASERRSIKRLLTVDASLGEYFTPILYELEPASSARATAQCVELVGTCQLFILIVGQRAGFMVGDISITHKEFERAAERHAAGAMKILVFIKKVTGEREPGAKALLEAVRATGVKYKEFDSLETLDDAVQRALRQALRDGWGISNLPASASQAKFALAAASDAENNIVSLFNEDLDFDIARKMIARWDQMDARDLKKQAIAQRLNELGHVVKRPNGKVQATLAGAIVLGKRPSAARGLRSFCITAEAYAGTNVSGRVNDHMVIEGSVLKLVDGALAFVSRNTRQRTRVLGARRIEIHEYPQEAVREAIVNAIAHRSYEDTGARIVLRVFHDRVSVTSPGLPPGSLTPARLKVGDANPVARNPLIAQSLFHLEQMEQRGTGFRRIGAFVGPTGLRSFDLAVLDGFFTLTLMGPSDAIEHMALPASVIADLLPPSRLDGLNERQRDMAERLVRGETLTSRDCEQRYKVTRDTTARDFKALVDSGVAARLGGGRSIRYVFVDFAATRSSD